MFRAPDHRYDRAIPGSFRLVPTEEMHKKLAADYRKMSVMIFGQAPSFDTVITSILDLENFLNGDSVVAQTLAIGLPPVPRTP
jgi:hypothetical protein